jgi:hypothetical protein
LVLGSRGAFDMHLTERMNAAAQDLGAHGDEVQQHE